jgi:hypothetical protein
VHEAAGDLWTNNTEPKHKKGEHPTVRGPTKALR